MRPTRAPHTTTALILALLAGLGSACNRANPPPAPSAAPAPAAPETFTPPSAPGEVGPLGSDCYDTKQAKACPPDPTDPSGKKLPAHGGACRFPLCRPCGSETAVAFRDEHGAPSSGFCICVPTSDSSGRGTLSCYSTKAWKSRAN
ncbi:MAG TPA: hypothetical protein VHM31_07745 [Polyangia bacterium]|nr:hypothetical protein [Polyangia bacterium]